jgi:hypothetical protein
MPVESAAIFPLLRYRQTIRPLLLQSANPAVSAIIAALDARF